MSIQPKLTPPALLFTNVLANFSFILQEVYTSEEQFNKKARSGVVEGFYWAYVTQTTMG